MPFRHTLRLTRTNMCLRHCPPYGRSSAQHWFISLGRDLYFMILKSQGNLDFFYFHYIPCQSVYLSLFYHFYQAKPPWLFLYILVIHWQLSKCSFAHSLWTWINPANYLLCWYIYPSVYCWWHSARQMLWQNPWSFHLFVPNIMSIHNPSCVLLAHIGYFQILLFPGEGY